MKIKRVRVINYKGFRDSGDVAFGDKFTVFVGQNNAGKTALLEALSTQTFKSNPFREHMKRNGFPPVHNPQSEIIFQVAFTGAELRWRMLDVTAQFQMPVNHAEGNPSGQVESFFSNPEINFETRFVPGKAWQPVGPSPWPANLQHRVDLKVSEDRQQIQISPVASGRGENIIPQLIGPYIRDSLYVFRAERMNVPECPIGASIELQPDASNLASVLLQLDRYPTALEKFTNYVRTIFPTIFSVISTAKEGAPSIARIDIINRDFNEIGLQPGITVPLADSGTGISQVLAILCVVVTARTPRVIIIDEPNTFLHPGAAKKLIAILKEFDHQYIFTTHSADIIRAVEPDVLQLVKWADRESKIETLNSRDVADVRRLLRELGVQLADVFGADNVLWVEGATEEICFPLLIKLAKRPLPAATVIVAMVATDDFSSRRARRSLPWEVYERLSIGSALVPPALAFSFDQERRTEIEIQDMVRRSRGKAHFLPRLTYENYLLDADAISGVLQSTGVQKRAADVQGWIDANGNRREYFSDSIVAITDPRWRVVVNAPRLLADLFAEMSAEAPIRYEKLKHSVAITEWMINNKPSELTELVEYVANLLGK